LNTKFIEKGKYYTDKYIFTFLLSRFVMSRRSKLFCTEVQTIPQPSASIEVVEVDILMVG
jgi:hypothetical protein